MKGSYFLGNKTFEVREMVIPEPGDKDILVKNMVCGICGSDVHTYHGESTSAKNTVSVILGHEYSGIVEKVGHLVTSVKPGDKVTIDPNIYCGYCAYCRNGMKQLCENLSAIGVNRDGGFAEYSMVPAEQAFILDEHVDYETGAMSEPLACCIHGIDLAGIHVGDDVLIVGGGAIGLMMVQLAKMAGAARVMLSEPVKVRQEMGIRLGADASFDPTSQDPAEQIRKLTGKDGVDIIIECAGNASATKQSFDCAGRGATILLFSVPFQDVIYELPRVALFRKELTIKSSFVNPDSHGRAVKLINTGKIQIKPMITHRFGINEVEKAILAQMSDESIKVVVRTDI